MQNNWNSHLLLAGYLAVSYRTKHTFTIQWSSNHALWYLPIGTEKLCPHKNLHMDVYNSFFHNCQNLKSTKVFFNRRMDKQTMVYPYKGIAFSAKKKRLWSHEKTWKKLKCILLSEKRPICKGLRAYYMIAVWNLGKGKSVETVKRSVVARGCGEGEKDGWSPEF